MKSTLLTSLLFLLTVSALAAERVYVTDKLEVQMRSGASLQHRILKMIPSGTALTVLESDESTGYKHVALESGDEGWILSRYLTSQPVARVLLDELQSKSGDVGEENKSLRNEINVLRSGKESLEKTSQELRAETSRLNTELIAVRHASQNALQIQAERDELQKANIDLLRDLEAASRKLEAQDASTKQNWFLIGAGVLFGGLLLGLILPRMSWRKRSSWDSF